MVIPILMLEKVTDLLASNGQFDVNGEKLFVRFQVKPSGQARVNTTADGAFKFEIPVNIDLDSALALLPKATTGVITVIARPRVDLAKGVVLDFISSSVSKLHGRIFSLRPALSDRILSEIFKKKIQSIFPKEALIQSAISVTSNLRLQPRETEVFDHGLGITFDLQPTACTQLARPE